MHPQAARLKDFLVTRALALPAQACYVHEKAWIPGPTLFTLADFQRHLSNPLLPPASFSLFHQGRPVDLDAHACFKVVQGKKLFFMDKTPVDHYLAQGAACVLEGLDILDPAFNALAAEIDAVYPHPIMACPVVFFSQHGNEAYRGHFDSDDVLVLQLEGRKQWSLHERQRPRMVDKSDLPPAAMGAKIAEVVMEPGDALYVRSAVPHSCRTLAPYSLHLSFDLADRGVHIGTLLEMLYKFYERDCAPAYASEERKLEHLAALGASPALREAARGALASYRAELRAYRSRMGASRVHFFDGLLKGGDGGR